MDDLHKEIKKQLLHALIKHMDKDNGSRLSKMVHKPDSDIKDLTKRPSEDLVVHNDNPDIQDSKAEIVKDAMTPSKKQNPDPSDMVENENFADEDDKKKKYPFKK